MYAAGFEASSHARLLFLCLPHSTPTTTSTKSSSKHHSTTDLPSVTTLVQTHNSFRCTHSRAIFDKMLGKIFEVKAAAWTVGQIFLIISGALFLLASSTLPQGPPVEYCETRQTATAGTDSLLWLSRKLPVLRSFCGTLPKATRSLASYPEQELTPHCEADNGQCANEAPEDDLRTWSFEDSQPVVK